MKQYLKFLFIFLLLFGEAGRGLAQKPASAEKATAAREGQALIDSVLQLLSSDSYRNKEDSNKVQLLNNLSFGYREINPDQGIKYGQQALDLSSKLAWKRGIAHANISIGVNYLRKSDFPNSLECFFKALKIDEEIGDKIGIAHVVGSIGVVYEQQNDYPKALEYYFKELKMREESRNNNLFSDPSGNIGEVYMKLGDYPKALKYFFKVLKRDEENRNKYGIGFITMNIGETYACEENYSLAIAFMQRSLATCQEIRNKYFIAWNLCNIGKAYISIVKDTQATLLPGSIHLENVTDTDLLSERKYLPPVSIPADRATLLHNAVDYLQSALVSAKEIPAPDVLQSCYENLAEAYRLDGDYKQSLEYYRSYMTIKDSVFSKENNEKIVKLGMQNDYEINRLADSLKTADVRKIGALELQHQRTYSYIGLAIIALLSGFAFSIARNSKLLAKEKQKSDDLLIRSDGLLLNILPAEVADELKDKGSSAAKYFDHVTVLFTDFVNFTNAGERMSPQALIDELHTCFKAFDEITGKYNIEKIKTIGDAYLAVAGLPLADPKHAENMVSAAIEINTFMAERLAKLGEKTFAVRIGIHSGSVVAGIVGVKKFAYDIWGDTVNTAARMEQNSEAGKINISETTYELVKDRFVCEYRGEIEAKNKGQLKMYFVS